MGYFKQIDIENKEREEFGALDFDNHIMNDDDTWWHEQDAQMRAEELEHIEAAAEIQEYRTRIHVMKAYEYIMILFLIALAYVGIMGYREAYLLITSCAVIVAGWHEVTREE